MDCLSPVQLETDQPSTLKDFVIRRLGPGAGTVVEDASWTALAEEIWNDPLNQQNVGASPHDRKPSDSSSAADNVIDPDEWIYLPAPQMRDPYRLEVVHVVPGAPDDAVIHEVLRANAAIGTADGRNIPVRPEDLTIDMLKDVLFNAALRTQQSSSSSDMQPVYFFTVPALSPIVDAVPRTTCSTGKNTAMATPPWLRVLWHWIDELHRACDAHGAAVDELAEIKAAAEVAVGVLTKMDKFLDIYEKYKATSIVSVNLFQVQERQLRTAIRDKVFDKDAPLPQVDAVKKAWEKIDGIQKQQSYKDAYVEFTAVRDAYPATAHAMDMVTAWAAVCGAFTPGVSDDWCQKVVDIANGQKAPDSPDEETVTLDHVFNVLKMLSDNFATPATTTVGNVPGPATMSVVVMKIITYFRLAKGDELQKIAETTQKVFLWTSAAYGFRATSFGELVEVYVFQGVAVNLRGKKAVADARKLREVLEDWEKFTATYQKGRGLTKFIAGLAFLEFISSLPLNEDVRKQWSGKWYEKGQARVTVVYGGLTAAGAVAQLLCKAEADGSWQKTLQFATGNTGFPLVIGVAALCQAVFYAAEASNSDDKSKWWDSVGAFLTGVEPFIPIVVRGGIRKVAPQLAEGVFARIAAAALGRAAAEGAAEVGAEGAAALGAEAIATFLSGVGTLIILGLFVVRNWETITAARPKQTCNEWLEYIENSRVGKLGPSGVKDAIANAKKALGNASWASASDYLMRQDLQAAGLPLEDIASFMEPADSLLQ